MIYWMSESRLYYSTIEGDRKLQNRDVEMTSNPLIYLDNAATTPCDPRVIEEMKPYWVTYYGNPSSPHLLGQHARQIVERCRKDIKDALNGSGTIIFTSSSTESNNIAVFSLMRYSLEELKRRKILCLSVEHKSVINAITSYGRQLGIEIEWIPVTKNGIIDFKWFYSKLNSSVGAVIVQLANSETGIIQDIQQIAEACRNVKALLFSDITQAIGKIKVDLDKLGVDYASFSAHKFYGPKGIGALYIAPSRKITPMMFGGGQEKGIRPGTENVPGIVGLTSALRLCVEELEQNTRHLAKLRERLWEHLKVAGEIRWNGWGVDLLPSHLNVTIRHVNAQELMLRMREVAFSAGSACNTASNEPSYVLTNMGLSKKEAEETIRLTVGKFNTPKEIDLAGRILVNAIKEIRSEKL